jgi:hypothetical protein
MRVLLTSFFVVVASPMVAGCGGEMTGISGGDSPDSSSTSATSGGSGSFVVMADLPNGGDPGGSYERSVTFTGPACATTQLGACQIDPCYVKSSSQGGSAPADVGPVSIDGAEMTSLSLEPQSNGNYSASTVEGQLPWRTGGEPVTMRWAHGPGDTAQPGGAVTLASPPYIALSPDSTFAAHTSAVSRARDLGLSWTSSSPPTAADIVIIDLISPNSSSNSGLSTRVLCQFDAGTGQGVVPASALGLLSSGEGSFDVHSKEYSSQTLYGSNGTSWRAGFNVMAHARTSYGLAAGAVTIE